MAQEIENRRKENLDYVMGRLERPITKALWEKVEKDPYRSASQTGRRDDITIRNIRAQVQECIEIALNRAADAAVNDGTEAPQAHAFVRSQAGLNQIAELVGAYIKAPYGTPFVEAPNDDTMLANREGAPDTLIDDSARPAAPGSSAILEIPKEAKVLPAGEMPKALAGYQIEDYEDFKNRYPQYNAEVVIPLLADYPAGPQREFAHYHFLEAYNALNKQLNDLSAEAYFAPLQLKDPTQKAVQIAIPYKDEGEKLEAREIMSTLDEALKGLGFKTREIEQKIGLAAELQGNHVVWVATTKDEKLAKWLQETLTEKCKKEMTRSQRDNLDRLKTAHGKYDSNIVAPMLEPYRAGTERDLAHMHLLEAYEAIKIVPATQRLGYKKLLQGDDTETRMQIAFSHQRDEDRIPVALLRNALQNLGISLPPFKKGQGDIIIGIATTGDPALASWLDTLFKEKLASLHTPLAATPQERTPAPKAPPLRQQPPMSEPPAVQTVEEMPSLVATVVHKPIPPSDPVIPVASEPPVDQKAFGSFLGTIKQPYKGLSNGGWTGSKTGIGMSRISHRSHDSQPTLDITLKHTSEEIREYIKHVSGTLSNSDGQRYFTSATLTDDGIKVTGSEDNLRALQYALTNCGIAMSSSIPLSSGEGGHARRQQERAAAMGPRAQE